MKRTTIKDLAKMLQVSTSTVSRALSNHPDISDSVKVRVREVAGLLNYHPSDFAINFRRNSTKVIGLIVPKISMFFIPAILDGISTKLKKEGYNFFILSSEESVAIEGENILTCSNSRVDGILISLCAETENLDHFKIAQDLEVPIVVFDKSIDQNDYDEVVFNNEESAEKCALRLIDMDCKNILAVFGSANLSITEKRKAGFMKIMTENKSTICHSIYADSSEQARELVENLLNTEKYDAIFAMSDEVLAGIHIALMNSKSDLNLIKVVAISEGILPKYLNSNYEFEKNDGLKMGLKAAEILVQKIQNKEKATDSNRYFI